MSNRGRRYSFESIMKQHSIDCSESQISKDILTRWKRDVLYNFQAGEEVEYIIKCYSLPGDSIHILNPREDA